MENVHRLLLDVVETIFVNCLSMLASALRPKHERGDDKFGYHILDSFFQLAFLLFVCLFLPLWRVFPLF